MKSKKSKSFLYIILALVLLGVIGFGVWRILDLRSEVASLEDSLNQTTAELDELKSAIVADPNSAVTRLQQEQNASILDEIASVYALPEDETPTIATVQDISKLTDQPFFEGAENGDILVVFDESSQALLYRPSSKQLVKVGPISVGEGASESAPAAAPNPEPSEE